MKSEQVKKYYKYLYFSLIYIAAIFFMLYFGDKFFTAGTEPGPSLFKSYADKVFSGQTPYRDFLFEYPPFSLVFILIPRIFTADFFLYQIIFWIELGIFGLLGLWMTINLLDLKKVSNSEKIIIPLIYIILIFVFGIINFSRYDMIPAILTLGAVWLKIKNKPAWAYFVLGLAVATKIYPAVVLPLFFIQDYREWKKALNHMLFFVGGVLIAVLPFISHLSDLKTFISYQSGRGIQLESFWANILLVKHLFTSDNLRVISEAGALGLVPYPKYFVSLSYFLMIAFLIFTYWLFWKRKNDLVLYSFLTILIFIIFNRVFSPQYLIWILVFFPIIINRKIIMSLLAGCFFIATLITRNIYPHLYSEQNLLGFNTRSIISLSLRNVSLIIVLLALIIGEVGNLKKDLVIPPKDSELHRG